MTTLIAEDVLLLLLDDETGRLESTHYDPLLGGAVLLELAMSGNLEVRKAGAWSSAKVQVLTDGRRPESDVLRDGLHTVQEKERTAQDLVNRIGKGLKDRLLAGLVERGVVRLDEDKVLGLFPRKRWPAVDSGHEDEGRREISAALINGVTPDEHTAALIALLHSVDRAHRTVDNQGTPGRQVKARAKEISEGEWAAKAVKEAVAAAQAAMTAVMVATTAAGAAGAGS
ncbi:MAG: GPP34 family phosphoprotein [Nocardioides sp.]|nr:GPP34 family phosphoprotein [Nocardioides sp.]